MPQRDLLVFAAVTAPLAGRVFGLKAAGFCDTAQLQVTHPLAGYGGVFTRTNRWINGRPHYANPQDSHLYFYSNDGPGSSNSSWNFDDRSQLEEDVPGQRNWARGGYFIEDGRHTNLMIPTGSFTVLNYDGNSGRASIHIHCIRNALDFCDTAQIRVHQPIVGYGGVYTLEGGVINDKPHYRSEMDKVLYYYGGGQGGTAGWCFDDAAEIQPSAYDFDGLHRGGYLAVASPDDTSAPSGSFVLRDFDDSGQEVVVSIECVTESQTFCRTHCIQVEHVMASYSGVYTIAETKWNGKAVYANPAGSHLFFDDSRDDGVCSWSFDNHSQAAEYSSYKGDWSWEVHVAEPSGGYVSVAAPEDPGPPAGDFVVYGRHRLPLGVAAITCDDADVGRGADDAGDPEEAVKVASEMTSTEAPPTEAPGERPAEAPTEAAAEGVVQGEQAPERTGWFGYSRGMTFFIIAFCSAVGGVGLLLCHRRHNVEYGNEEAEMHTFTPVVLAQSEERPLLNRDMSLEFGGRASASNSHLSRDASHSRDPQCMPDTILMGGATILIDRVTVLEARRRQANGTVDEAHRCIGFYYEGSSREDQPVEIHFMAGAVESFPLPGFTAYMFRA